MHAVDLLVVDVDGADNPWPGDKSHAQELTRGLTANTPGGGTHHFFRFPEDKTWKNSAGKLAPNVDIRTGGGYVVVSPSVIGDKIYTWADGNSLDSSVDTLPEPPPWLQEALDGINGNLPPRVHEAPQDGNSAPQRAGENSPSENTLDHATKENLIPEGQRNCTLSRLAGSMRRNGMGKEEILAGISTSNRIRCHPPLVTSEVERIADSIASYESDQLTVAVIENHYGQDFKEEPTGPRDPGPFPDRLLHVPGFVSEVMEYNLAMAFKPQPVLALSGALCLQGVLAARKVRDPRDNRTNLYVVGVAPSGAGKDHARKVNRNILFQAGLSHLEGNEDFASDSGLVNAVDANPGILFQVDEIGRLLKTLKDSRNTHLYNIITILLRMYSNANTVYRGKAYADRERSTDIVQPCVLLYGLTVPENLYQSLTADNLVDGFLARLLIFEVEGNPSRQRVEQVPVPESILEKARFWGKFTVNLDPRTGQPDPVVVRCTDKANEIFDALAERVDEEMINGDSACRALWSRVEENTCRLSLIYACSRDPEHLEIDADASQWASDLSVHLVQRMLFLADQWVADGAFDAHQKKVLRILREKGGSISRTELTRRTQSLKGRDRDEVINNLIEAGQIVRRKKTTSGRAKVIYELR